MPGKARILVSNYPHHIVQRGHNRKAVFLADEDYQFDQRYPRKSEGMEGEAGYQIICLMFDDKSHPPYG